MIWKKIGFADDIGVSILACAAELKCSNAKRQKAMTDKSMQPVVGMMFQSGGMCGIVIRVSNNPTISLPTGWGEGNTFYSIQWLDERFPREYVMSKHFEEEWASFKICIPKAST